MEEINFKTEEEKDKIIEDLKTIAEKRKEDATENAFLILILIIAFGSVLAIFWAINFLYGGILLFLSLFFLFMGIRGILLKIKCQKDRRRRWKNGRR